MRESNISYIDNLSFDIDSSKFYQKVRQSSEHLGTCRLNVVHHDDALHTSSGSMCVRVVGTCLCAETDIHAERRRSSHAMKLENQALHARLKIQGAAHWQTMHRSKKTCHTMQLNRVQMVQSTGCGKGIQESTCPRCEWRCAEGGGWVPLPLCSSPSTLPPTYLLLWTPAQETRYVETHIDGIT